MNRWVLTARLEERGALRFTPAGLPALDLGLAHESEVSHEGQRRKVALQVKALAIGTPVDILSRMPLGTQAGFSGFLAPARNGRGLLFHITELAVDAG
jgi:primosomal replication protein N